MYILKLIFEHDLPLKTMGKDAAEIKSYNASLSLEDFLKPEPVYSHFYLTATLLEENPRFGLNTLPLYPDIIASLESSLQARIWHTEHQSFATLNEALNSVEIGSLIVGTTSTDQQVSIQAMTEQHSGSADTLSLIKTHLEKDHIVLFKEVAHHGWDIQLYSLKNRYEALFYALQPYIIPGVRMFSMNGKRLRSERLFYFETWSLENPPHGVEEVFRSTEI
jgi:hypothetical protein